MEELQLTDKPSVTFSAATSPPRVTEEPSVQVPVRENGEELMVSGPETVAGARVGPDGAAVVVVGATVVVFCAAVVVGGAAVVVVAFNKQMRLVVRLPLNEMYSLLLHCFQLVQLVPLN